MTLKCRNQQKEVRIFTSVPLSRVGLFSSERLFFLESLPESQPVLHILLADIRKANRRLYSVLLERFTQRPYFLHQLFPAFLPPG